MVALIAAGGGAYLWSQKEDPEHQAKVKLVAACDVPLPVLERLHNGYYPGRSGDILAAEQLPNQFGTRHSTPYPYTQEIPIVLYGPGFIRSGVTADRPVTAADIAPTLAELLDFDEFPERDGRVLEEALLPEAERKGVPRLIFTLVWDGGGDNVLEQWPDSWPHLKRLMSRGTSYSEATVGSTPSITPAIHATIGTGAFPSHHGLPDTRMRVQKDRIVDAWENSSPRYLKLRTLADLWDSANGNAPLVGMLARDNWHLGMIGHGAFLSEGDSDIAVMDQLGGVEFRTNPAYYSLPEYLLGLDGLQEAIDEVDIRDGEGDQSWLGNPLLPFDGRIRETPAWSIYQSQKIVQLLTNEGFGADEVPDLFFTNYKSTDLAGHTWNMTEPEERDDLAEQDRQLAFIIKQLDKLVGKNNYVLAMTADHGQTPYPMVTGGWAIETPDMTADIEKRFDKTTPNKPLVLSNRGYQIMLDPREVEKNNVDPADIAAFVRDYRIEDNVTPSNQVLKRFEGKTDERLFLTALTPDELERALTCARSRA
ncbi:MAG: hypothetical protein QOK47_953 [Actinomycetota bacterium]|nr:hypothetical protein [Actinomycetota bacterium]